MRDDSLYLVYIKECIERIEEYTSEGREFFLRDRKTQDAVLRNLQTLAESTQRLSDRIKDAETSIDWKSIAGFRNIVVHDYLGINLNRVWLIVEKDLPPLKHSITSLLNL
jgi:uncharacterized protein with HEPN domain